MTSMERVLNAHIASLVDEPAEAILSDPSLLNRFRCKLHYYQATVLDAELVWRYRIFDFDECAPSGAELVTTYNPPDPRNSAPSPHDARLAVRGSRVLMVRRRLSGQEPPVVAVFPQAAQGFRVSSPGLVFLQNWDGDHAVLPCLLSFEPILESEEGTMAQDCAKALEKQWRQEMKGTYVILPDQMETTSTN